MKPLYKLSSLAATALLANSVWAAPSDVPKAPYPAKVYEKEGELQPHHQLKAPQDKPSEPEPLPPPAVPDVAIDAGEISISESGSVLAYQGILVPEAHGFRDSVWQYMDQDEATTWLSVLPEEPKLSVLKDRIISLLSLRADPPRDAKDSWLALRLAALEKLGASKQAETLLASIPPGVRSEMQPLALFRFFMRLGNAVAACEAIRDAQQPDTISSQEWQRLEVFCDGAMGDFAEVELALALADEAGTPYPDWFIRVVEKFQYPDVELPNEDEAPDALGQMMIGAAAGKPLPLGDEAEEDAVGYPKRPSYAIKAISKLLRLNQPEQTQEWLAMLDTGTTESASSYVAHELVRFVQSSDEQARSVAAMTLPPYSGLADATGADVRLLVRFYKLMQSFDYRLPVPTLEWLAQKEPDEYRPTNDNTTHQLNTYAKAGNKAGYLLALADFLAKHDVADLSTPVLNGLIFDLKRLDEEAVARQLAVEAVLQAFE